jgi:hypothetical protein
LFKGYLYYYSKNKECFLLFLKLNLREDEWCKKFTLCWGLVFLLVSLTELIIPRHFMFVLENWSSWVAQRKQYLPLAIHFICIQTNTLFLPLCNILSSGSNYCQWGSYEWSHNEVRKSWRSIFCDENWCTTFPFCFKSFCFVIEKLRCHRNF